MPNVLWIWDLVNLRQVALIQQLLPIKSVHWNPVRPGLLALTCGTGHLYLWGADDGSNESPNNTGTMGHRNSMGGCEAIEVPAVNFQVMKLAWSPDGGSLSLMDKDKFCLAFLVEDEGTIE